MNRLYFPEGGFLETAENRALTSTPQGLEKAMNTGAIVEGIVTLCDGNLNLHVDIGCAEGIIPVEEAVLCRAGETRKDIAVISRVGKPVACKILRIEHRAGGLFLKLSRVQAQKECLMHYLDTLRVGDIIEARVTHLEPFGAFLDIGCGVSSLLSVDCVSISRISHPRDRLRVGMTLPVVVKSLQEDTRRIYVTLRELLGTWEQNASFFEAGQTVTGIVRSVEQYGVFVELAPNLAGLAEVSEEDAVLLRGRIGQHVSVYIKSILPERMKIKLVLIDPFVARTPPSPPPLRFFLPPEGEKHLSRWVYSPSIARKTVSTVFDEE